MESFSTLTCKQLENFLSQHIQALYLGQLGHQPGKVACQLFDEKLAIFLEDAITRPEQLLIEVGRKELAQEVRRSMEIIFQPRLQALIEEVTHVAVSDFLTAAQLDTGRVSIIAILAERPICVSAS